MKELSIEEKAKRYDEAIEKAKSKIKNDKDHVLYENDIIEIFPELKESEDERIRKNIIKAFKIFADKQAWVGHCLDDIDWDACIAWLEKQGEHNVYKESFNEGYKLGYREASENITEEPEKYGLQKQGEQKPADVRTTGYWFVEDTEQNPAWSEEDEYCRHQLIVFCENCMVQDAGAKRCTHWLKSLKDRVHPQPKQDWGEEDEKEFEQLLNILHANGYESFDIWLKSLRPQKQWKVVDKEIYVEEPAIAQKKDKSEPNHGYVICYDHTLTPDVYERFIMISDIHPQKHWKPSSQQICSVDYVIKEYESTNISLNKEAVKQLISLREQLKAL